MINSSSRPIFETLREVCAAREPIGVAEVSRRLNLSLSTAQRSLLTLTQSGYLKRHPYTPKYQIGFTAERLINALLEKFTIRPASVAFLRRLATTSRATASLYVKLGWYSIRIVGIEAHHSSSTHSRTLGGPALLDRDAASLAILAYLQPEELEQFVRFKAAPLSEAADGKRLAEIRARGFAFQTITADAGSIESLAFPILDAAGQVVASVSIEGSPHDSSFLHHRNLPDWQSIVAELMHLLHAKRGLCVNPFAHLDPQQIRFGKRALEDSDVDAASSADVATSAATPPGMGLLQGKVVVIAEGTGETGQAMVMRFLQAGATVMVAGGNTVEAEQTVALAHEAGYPTTQFAHAHIEREGEIERLLEHAANEFGRLDCVLHYAGAPAADRSLLDTTVEEFETEIGISLVAVFHWIKHAGKFLQSRGRGGSLITVSSPVSAVRAALEHLTQEFAQELEPSNIRVMYLTHGNAGQRNPEAAGPVRMVNQLRDLPDMAVFLAGDLSRENGGNHE